MTKTPGTADGDQLVEISGHRIHCRWVRPDLASTPLVFLHEGLGSIELWRDFPADVVEASESPGLAFSRRGNGWSDPLNSPRSADYMHREALETLPAIIDALVDKPPVLIGHSDGASISVIYAGSGYPVEGLVLIAPHVFVEEETIAAISAVRASFPGSDMGDRMSKYHRAPESTFKSWADVWLSPEFRTWNIEEYLGGIECPTLVVQGEEDEYGTLAQVDAVESQVGGTVERLVVAGANHAPHLAEPDLVASTTARFLSDLGGGRPDPAS